MWLHEEWASEWGEKSADDLSRVLASDPPLFVRASGRTGTERLLSALSDQLELPEGTALSLYVPTAICLPSYAPVLRTSLHQDGVLEIQDEGSQLIAHFALWPKEFEGRLSQHPGAQASDGPIQALPSRAKVVIDACAGAGGKTLALADLMAGKGRTYAYDVSDKNLQALRRRAKKARLNSVQTLLLNEGSEADSIKKFRETADLVLVDAPCSGFGILRRSPDIKWKSKPGQFGRLPDLQLRLLETYSSLVKPGGSLVYSLCTFRRVETHAVVDEFLKRRPEFKKSIGGHFGPNLGGADGFFMQELRREP
jgi:16S rRNA (cytosine967-C5)-methyltransferase